MTPQRWQRIKRVALAALSTTSPTCASSAASEAIFCTRFSSKPPPDLIIEVISESNRTHDTVVKFSQYAQYGVEEYWLVDPREEVIATWSLEGGEYSPLGRFGPRTGSGNTSFGRLGTGRQRHPGSLRTVIRRRAPRHVPFPTAEHLTHKPSPSVSGPPKNSGPAA